MGLCFSAPNYLTCSLHLPQAIPVSDVSLASVQAPSAVPNSISSSEGGKPGGLRHRDEEVEGRPRPLENLPNGVRRVALKALTYCLRPEGFLPRNTLFDGDPPI